VGNRCELPTTACSGTDLAGVGQCRLGDPIFGPGRFSALSWEDAGASGGTRTPSLLTRRSMLRVRPARQNPQPQVRVHWMSRPSALARGRPVVCEKAVRVLRCRSARLPLVWYSSDARSHRPPGFVDGACEGAEQPQLGGLRGGPARTGSGVSPVSWVCRRCCQRPSGMQQAASRASREVLSTLGMV
jgi:hypothetical protein